jgi:BirA family biotin operon repressor/biotin-[acetyl-CoA-carboxylase] ligase
VIFSTELHRFRSVSSTNSEVARFALEGAEEGLCVIADEQTAGRGRLQRRWQSPPGAGLYFSLLLRPKFATERWPLLTLMAAVACHSTLRFACGLLPDIKWPNDILVDGRKICGILAETLESPAGRAVVLGIGINLKSEALPEELRLAATSVEEATGRLSDREAILQTLLAALADNYQLLQTGTGNSQILKAWCDASSYARGRLIRVTTEQRIIEGITRGLEDDGALRVETSDGDTTIVRTGDVTSLRPAE